MTNYSLDVMAYRVQALHLRLAEIESNLAILDAAYSRLLDLAAEQRDRIEKLEERECK